MNRKPPRISRGSLNTASVDDDVARRTRGSVHKTAVDWERATNTTWPENPRTRESVLIPLYEDTTNVDMMQILTKQQLTPAAVFYRESGDFPELFSMLPEEAYRCDLKRVAPSTFLAKQYRQSGELCQPHEVHLPEVPVIQNSFPYLGCHNDETAILMLGDRGGRIDLSGGSKTSTAARNLIRQYRDEQTNPEHSHGSSYTGMNAPQQADLLRQTQESASHHGFGGDTSYSYAASGSRASTSQHQFRPVAGFRGPTVGPSGASGR